MVCKLLLSDGLVEGRCLFCQVCYGGRDGDTSGGVGTVRPVVLEAQVGHADLLIKVVRVVRVGVVYSLQDLAVL